MKIRFIGPPNILAHDMMTHMLGRHNIGADEYEFASSTCVPGMLNVLVGESALFEHTNVHGIDDYRGSIIPSTNGAKCVPIKYPSDAFYNGVQYAILDLDFTRIVEEASNESLPELPFKFVTGDEVTETYISLFEQAQFLAVDIESVKKTGEIICVGFARGPWEAISIFNRYPHERQWIQRLLNASARKIFHFGSFDSTMLILDGYEINAYTDDTIIQAHVLAPELPRDLGFLSSIYTKIPYFKSEGKTNIPGDAKAWSAKRDKAGLLTYNCKDCCATYQIFFEQKTQIEENDNHAHIYAYEMEMIPVAREIGMNGMLLDIDRNAVILEHLETLKNRLQLGLDTLCGTKINVASPKQMQIALYQGLGLPEKFKQASKKKKQEGIDSVLTADNDALVGLLSSVKTQLQSLKTEKAREPWKIRYLFITLAIQMRGVDKLLGSYINLRTHNGRIKSLYKVNGTETGRWSCSQFIDGSGINAQCRFLARDGQWAIGKGQACNWCAYISRNRSKSKSRSTNQWNISQWKDPHRRKELWWGPNCRESSDWNHRAINRTRI